MFRRVGQIAQPLGRGACLRANIERFVDPNEFTEAIRGAAGWLNLPLDQLDIIADLGPIENAPKYLGQIARMMLQAIPELAGWRRVILGATAMPQSLPEAPTNQPIEVPRTEWLLWNAVRKAFSSTRPIDFGDYAIAHPAVVELDMQLISPAAKIRYTTDEAWLVVRGTAVRRDGYDQWHELSEIIVEHEVFKGANFSWGDEYLYNCSKGVDGPGNLTTWVAVTTNHHLAFVEDQIANLGDS